MSHRLDKQQLLLGNKAAFIAPKLTAPCDPAQVSPRLSHEAEPQCAHCQHDLSQTEAQSACWVSRLAALAEDMGKTRKHQLPVTLWVSDVTGGIWPVLVPPSCSFGELHHGIKEQTQSWRSCMEK